MWGLKEVVCLMAAWLPWQAGVYAKEGMWLPPTLSKQERDLKAAGLQIAIDKIYNEKGTGLNNAVVLFGKGCTGEVISPKGLILTNHHCGYGSAQALSSTDHDYFANGYWAKNHKEELPCKGLTVTFIRRIENVTDKILAGVDDTLRDVVRDSIVNKRIAATEKEMATTTGYEVLIKPYFKGNQYWAAISETFRDIRFVGFPPNSIGAYGGDEENWMWPRHTGDFSLFRIYAGPDNKPADYSENNKPYEAPQFFTLNVGGIKEGDFTMVYGFPGTTNQYISSFALRQVVDINDPIAIEARTARLKMWSKAMSSDRNIFLKYTAKRATVANGWKKWQGEVKGLQMNDVVNKKRQYEDGFMQWAAKSTTAPYAKTLIPGMKTVSTSVDDLMRQEQYLKEAVLGVELIQQAGIVEKIAKLLRTNISLDIKKDSLEKMVKAQEGFYKNYDAATDKTVFEVLIPMWLNQYEVSIPAAIKDVYRSYNGNTSVWADALYNQSMLTSFEKLNNWATSGGDTMVLLSDPAWKLYDVIANHRKHRIQYVLTGASAEMKYMERLYMKAQMLYDTKKDFYPDANLTLRLAYGKVKGLDPDGDAPYSFQTTLDDVVKHHNPDSDIFKVPAKLLELHKAKDYGRWSQNGTVPVAFVADNHTSGGNSGSPVLNSRGELIGTNFDRAYEGTMSDYYFDPNRCRNISVDIRYTLFVIEKFGGAGWLLNEMKIETSK